MKKALALSAVAAAIGLCAMNASALPNGYQSVNFHGTLNFQNYSSSKDYFVTKVSVSNKDLLALVSDEFGTLPSGAQLVSRGLYYGHAYSEFFAVLNKNNDVVISDASIDGGDYQLNVDFSPSSADWTEAYVPGSGDTYNYQSSDAELVYSDYYDDNYFTITGFAKDTVNWDTYAETYSLPSGTGYFYLPMLNSSSYYNYGLITGSIGGSGKDVYPWDY